MAHPTSHASCICVLCLPKSSRVSNNAVWFDLFIAELFPEKSCCGPTSKGVGDSERERDGREREKGEREGVRGKNRGRTGKRERERKRERETGREGEKETTGGSRLTLH